MSAYIVEKNHILYLLAAAESRSVRQNYGPLSWYHNDEHHSLASGDYERAADVGNMLWRENMESVGFRYQGESSATLPGPRFGDSVITTIDVGRVLWNRIDPAQVLKACDCYEYQSCEHPGWKQSEAKAFIGALRRAAWHALPGYEAAEWGAPKPMGGQVIRLSSLCKK